MAILVMFLMILVSQVLNLWLGLPLWSGAVIVGALATIPGVVLLLSDEDAHWRHTLSGPRIVLVLSAICGTVITGLVAYIPMVAVSFWMGHLSW